MSGRTHMQMALTPIFQPPREAGPLFALTAPTLEPCSSPSTPAPRCRSFAWHGTEDDADHRRTWFIHSLLLQPDTWRAAANSSLAARSQRRPCGDGLQQSVSVECHLSRIFPAHPRSLARCLSRARRHSPFCFALRAPFGSGFPKKKSPFGCGPKYGRDFFFGASAERHAFGLGSGARSRRFAQECPEGNSGKSKQEKFQWHSTPTTSR